MADRRGIALARLVWAAQMHGLGYKFARKELLEAGAALDAFDAADQLGAVSHG